MMKKKKIEEEEEEERERPTQLVSATNSVAEATVMTSYLSEDIMENILSRLPVKSIKRFRCVCKLWDNLFRSPNFINMHYNRGVENENFNLILTEENHHMYSSIDNHCSNPSSLTCLEMAEINYPFKELDDSTLKVNIWGACNGLLCIIATRILEDIICIWNPSTKEYKKIPLPPNWSNFDAHDMNSAYGLGYDCDIGDYKMVYLTFSYDFDGLKCQVKVYTLGSNSWKYIPVNYPYGIRSPGVLVNGTLHWLSSDRAIISEGSCYIVSFDFGAERFTQVPMPEHLDDDEFFLNVSALGGCLCIYGTSYDEVCFEVWVMKDYGVRESWTKLFNITQQSLLSCNTELIQPFKNDEFLLYIASDNTKDSLVVYNPKKERVRTLEINLGYYFSAMTYVESLVSLDTGTYVVQERVVELKDYDEKEEKQEKDDVGLQLFQ